MEQPITADDISRDLIHFIAKSPSTFHAVRGIKAALLYAGFTEIREEDTWQIEKGGKYVVTRNGSALMPSPCHKKAQKPSISQPRTATPRPSRSKRIRRSQTAPM